jgi:hypothetical protein
MIKTVFGIIHGRTIELEEDPGLTDGQKVRIQLATPLADQDSNRLVRSAGLLAGEWSNLDDDILAQLQESRRLESRRDKAE